METVDFVENESPLAEVQKLSMPDVARQIHGAQAALRMASTFQIAGQDDYELAAEELQAVKSRWNALEKLRTSITGPINKGLKAVNALFAHPQGICEQAESAWKKAMLTYSDEQERQVNLRKAEAARLAEGERRRLAAEAQAIIDAAAAKQKAIDDAAAAVAAQARAEQDRLAKIAAEAKAAGDAAAAERADAEAEKVREAAEASAVETMRQTEAVAQTAATEAAAAVNLAAAVSTVPTFGAFRAPAAKGISTSKTIEVEVHDLLLLVQHVAANPALISLLKADDIRLRAYTKGLGMSCNLPGVVVFEASKMASRSAR